MRRAFPRPSRLLQAWIAQAAVPIEIHGAIDVVVLDQQRDRRVVSACRLDRRLERIAVEGAAVHRHHLRADGHARFECGAAPQDAADLAFAADREAARICEVAILALAFGVLDPLGRLRRIDQLVAALGDPLERRLRCNLVDLALQVAAPVVRHD